ncbi:MAG: sll1863 family stress response protein [Planctomycetota bacterium]|jgi:hypothetical protein
MARLSLVSCLLPLALSLAACDGGDPDAGPPVTADDVKKEVGEAVGAASEYAEQKLEAFLAAAETRLGDVQARIEKLRFGAERAGNDVQQEFAGRIEGLEKAAEHVEERLAGLRNGGAGAAAELTAGAEAALVELEQAMEDALAAFNEGRR